MAKSARFNLALGVVTDVGHWPQDAGSPWAYEPYVREMSVWAKLFDRVDICAPVAEGPMSGNQATYRAANIQWRPVRYSLSDGPVGRAHRLVQLPALARALYGLIRTSDLVLLRSPGHSALVGRIIADSLGVPHITKWAGYFGPFTGERLPRRLERYLVKRSRNPVLVYGPAESPPLISFLPAVMSEDELRRARDLSHGRTWEPPWKILSVGGLSDEKGFALAIRGLGRLQARSPHLRWRFTLIGDGPDASKLRELAKHSDIVDRVTFTGALSFDLAQCHYAEAHVVIMPGVQEGWPKPIPEAWAHGAVPLAAAAGIIPWILDGKQAGLTFAPTPDGLAGALHELLSNPPAMKAMASRGPRLAAELSLETFAARLERLLVDSCHLA